jgi:hypothetical protein
VAYDREVGEAHQPLQRQQNGYRVALEWKNGTKKTIDALNTGVKTFTLVLANGSTLESENVQDLLYNKLPQAAGNTLELVFYAASSAKKATPASKLLVEIDAGGAARSEVAYSTPKLGFRVNLTCSR